MAKWWDTQFGTSAQVNYGDPATAVQMSMVPDSLLPPTNRSASAAGIRPTAESFHMTEEEFAKYVTVNSDGSWSYKANMDGTLREKGFMGWVKAFASSQKDVASSIDKAISGVPVVGQAWGVQKWLMDKFVKQPLDIAATGAYWLYSNVASRPITTAVLQADKALAGHSEDLFSGSEWSESYGKAKSISPGQALAAGGEMVGFNPLETAVTLATGGLAYGPIGLWHQQQGQELDKIAADAYLNTDKYLYDTNYWSKKEGWKYDIGTGYMDATVGLIADPTIGIGKGVGAVRRATRVIEVAEGTTKGLKAGPITIVKPKTAEELVASDRFDKFFKGLVGKSPERIRLALERGRGSRYSAATSRDMSAQLADVLSKANSVDDWRLATRFAMGDADAFAEMSNRSTEFAIAYGKALDHRVNVIDADNLWRNSYEATINSGFVARPLRPKFGYAAGDREALVSRIRGKGETTGKKEGPPEPGVPHGQKGRPVEDRIEVGEQGNLFYKTPYYVPPVTGEEAVLLDRTYEQLALDGRAYQWNIKPFDPAQVPSRYYNDISVPGMDEWRVGIRAQLDADARQLEEMAKRDEWLAAAMTPGTSAVENPLFGSLREARFAGVGRDVVKQSERRMVQYYGLKATEGFQSRLIQNGAYGATVRFIGRMGDRLPTGVINHNKPDATQRLAEYLKASPVDKDQIPNIINQYSRIFDKSKSIAYIDDAVLPMVFEGFGKKYNMDLDTIQRFYNQFRTGKANEIAAASSIPGKQQFSAATDEAGVTVDRFQSGDRVVASPLLATQLQYTSAMPNITRFNAFLAKHADNIGRMRRAGIGARDVVTQFMDSYNHLFKFGSLFSMSYVARNLSEERLMMSAKLGAMTAFSDAARGGAHFIANRNPLGALVNDAGNVIGRHEMNKALPGVQSMQHHLSDHIAHLEERVRSAGTFGWQDEIPSLKSRIENTKVYLEEFNSYERELLSHAARGAKRLGEGTFMHNGHVVPEAFAEEYGGAIPREQITSSDSWKAVFSRAQAFGKEDMLRTGDHITVTPGDANHMDSWEKAVNNQILQDKLGRLIVNDDTGREAVKFLRSPEGAIYRKNIGIAGADVMDHIGRVKAMVDQYIPDAMRQSAKAGKVPKADFEAIKLDQRPLVHGDELRMALRGDGSTYAWVDRMTEKWFNGIPRYASDRLTWQPTYVRAHRVAMQEAIDLHHATQAKLGKSVDYITADTMNSFMARADKQARQMMREILYEPNRTNLSSMLRYVSPFFSSYTDSMARWGGLIIEQPDMIGKLAKIYNAPIAANLITDRNGDPIDQSGKNSSGEFVDMGDRIVNFQINPATRNLPKAIADQRINVSSLNVVTRGEPWWNPGFGPIVSVPANSIMRNYPNMSGLMNWMSPYGTQKTSIAGDIESSITPSWFEDMRTAWDEDGKKYQDSVFAAYRRQLIEHHQEGGPPPDWKKAESQAKNLWYLSALADGVLPGRFRGADKYQLYIDAYRGLMEQDASTARDEFMAKYGKDFSEYSDAQLFVANATKSGNGVPATVEGVMTGDRLSDLIKANPELGGFIVGDTARSGEFNQWALLNQRMTGQRTTVSAEDRVRRTNADIGWDAYVKISAAINAEMNNRGLTALNQKGAEDLAKLKDAYIYGIAEKYPDWADDFTESDRDAIPKRIDAFRTIVNDKRMSDNPLRSDVQYMKAYINERDKFMRELAAREMAGGSAVITARSNMDLYEGWNLFRSAIAESNTQFESVMNRYLANDDLQMSSIGPSAENR